MLRLGPYLFKQADAAPEFEQIHRLNYRTFVQEIPQYDGDGTGRLVDKFHTKNTYFIALRGGRLVGMLCAHDRPPFSVAGRMPDPALLDAPGVRPLEVRLLAVEPDERHTGVFAGLIWSLYQFARRRGHSHLVISGVENQVPLYEHIGFQALGPAVGAGGAKFVPMWVALPRLEAKLRRAMELFERRLARLVRDPVCLLPGPVALAPAVRAAIAEPPVYHRGDEFVERFARLRHELARLVGAVDAAVLVGSGTSANEAVAANLAAAPRAEAGLVLVNGHFGERLARQAPRFGLRPRVLSWPWGQPWPLDEVAAALDELPPGGWVWGVHQESSTGVLNDLPGLVELARERGLRVCADCVSSLGAVPLNLGGVWLAAGASGKSLGSYAGLAFVFTGRGALAGVDTERVPSYFDVSTALAGPGPRYTVPSPLARALEVALEAYATPELAQERYDHYAALGALVRERLRSAGLAPLADDHCASPVITTFAPPDQESSAEFVERCASWGYQIAGHSGYLAERGLVQVATMGALSRDDVAGFFDQLDRARAGRAELAGAV